MAEDNKSGMRIVLAGNPNCGKTTIFNNITGARQHVGNYPGVTVERVEGRRMVEGEEYLFIDLPGTYSLTARSMDELVARNVIINETPDVLINVVDASNLERNLYLTAQLVELETPMVLALNMVDVAEDMGYHINIKKLSELLGANVVSTVARTNKGTKELLSVVAQVAAERGHTPVKVNYGEGIEAAIQTLVAEMESKKEIRYPRRWVAIKLLENDPDLSAKVATFPGGSDLIQMAAGLREGLAAEVDFETVFQEKRHEFAVSVFDQAVEQSAHMSETRSDKIDKLLTNRWLGLPIFALIMYVMFNLVFTLGEYPQGLLEDLFTNLGDWVNATMEEGPLRSLIVDGIIAGVGAVLSFLPLILLLFLGISFLEDSGYMARAAFVIDRAMRGVGLHGKSFIPLLLGFGCSVPAVMGSRILDNPRDRLVTILATPFMSCGAKLPVYILLIGAFFPAKYGGTILFCVYTFGVLLALITTKIFRSTLLKGEPEPFVMEMPPYHWPTPKSVALHMWERTWMYIRKAGTFIMAASILVWALVSFPDLTPDQVAKYDAQREQITQTYDAKGEEILAKHGVTTEDMRSKVAALVDEMNAKYEEAQEAEEEEEPASEEESVHDRVMAEREAGESAAQIEEQAEEKAFEAPESFQIFEKEQPELYPVALAMFENKLAMDEETGKVDEAQAQEKQEQSFAAMFGKAVEPIIKPLGFDWKIGVGVVASMAAKEVLISTLGIIYATQADDEHNDSLQYILATDPNFSPAVALALMAFVLVYPPCIAALSVVRKESNLKWMTFIFCYGNVFAWVVAFLVYRIALAVGFGS